YRTIQTTTGSLACGDSGGQSRMAHLRSDFLFASRSVACMALARSVSPADAVRRPNRDVVRRGVVLAMDGSGRCVPRGALEPSGRAYARDFAVVVSIADSHTNPHFSNSAG